MRPWSGLELVEFVVVGRDVVFVDEVVVVNVVLCRGVDEMSVVV